MGGHCQAKVAEKLAISKSTVSGHVRILKEKGFIKAVKGKSNPQLYCKGPKANLLDKYIMERGVRFSGGTANAPPSSASAGSPPPVFVPEVRVHANGRVIFRVDKAGDTREIVVREHGKELYRLPLFPKDPYLPPEKARGISAWKCKVPYNGQDVSIEYREGKDGSYLYVWPSQVMMTPDQLEDREIERVMFSQAQDVANFLSKHGGWRLSLPEFAGTIEKASDDPALLSQIEEEVRTIPGSGLWVDRSEGPRELETNDTSTARLVFGFRDVVKELQDGQQVLVNQIYTLNLTVAQALELIQKLTQMNVQLATAQAVKTQQDLMAQASQRAAGAAVPANQESSSPFSTDKYEVMYR